MPRVRPLEVNALTPLLEQDWETPEALAEALITELDKVRASRTSYVVVIQHGLEGKCFYSGMGPYPGDRSAINALKKRGLDRSWERAVIVPILTDEGFKKKMQEMDKTA